MRVSVVCPTYGRPERHERLHRVFVSQSYEDKDLWILDDSPEPSPFFRSLHDSRVHYLHSAGRMKIGAKRNWLLACCRGDVIAHFDDDDWYAPEYLATMTGELLRRPLDFVKLSVWNALSELDGSFWQVDTRHIQAKHVVVSSDAAPEQKLLTDAEMASLTQEVYDGNLWGYGFSYVYRRFVGERCPFLPVDFGEDFEFVKRVRKLATIGHVEDRAGLVVHTMHPKNTATRIFPQTRLDPELVPRELRPPQSVDRSVSGPVGAP
jgi:glycosyltransferase involved in cell wall biosynthesis